MGRITDLSARKLTTRDGISEAIASIVQRAALPVHPGERVKSLINRSSKRLRIPYGQAKRLWYREIKNIPAHVAMALLEYDRRTEDLNRQRAEIEAQLERLGSGP
jgi:hypothetical protein